MPDVGPDTGPSFRLWPPVSVGVPLLAGLLLSWSAGDPWGSSRAATTVGWILLGVFAMVNGWALLAMGRHGTGLLRDRAPHHVRQLLRSLPNGEVQLGETRQQ